MVMGPDGRLVTPPDGPDHLIGSASQSFGDTPEPGHAGSPGAMEVFTMGD
jgi:hypothetical protein